MCTNRPQARSPTPPSPAFSPFFTLSLHLSRFLILLSTCGVKYFIAAPEPARSVCILHHVGYRGGGFSARWRVVHVHLVDACAAYAARLACLGRCWRASAPLQNTHTHEQRAFTTCWLANCRHNGAQRNLRDIGRSFHPRFFWSEYILIIFFFFSIQHIAN